METSIPRQRFRVDWVLVDELAIGPAPIAERHLQRLDEAGIRAVFSLCAEHEAPPPAHLHSRFECDRLVLPDHRSNKAPEPLQILNALERLKALKVVGPVFVHCVAAMERSPLICLAWLVREHHMAPQAALDYLMQVHPGTNPLPYQLALLQDPALLTGEEAST